MANTVPNVTIFINGKDVPTSSSFPVRNPLTQEVVYTCSSATVENARQAVYAADDAFKSWSKSNPAQRRSILNKAADILLSKTSTAHELMSNEVGASTIWRTANILGSAAFIREAAAIVTQIKGEVLPSDRPGTTTLIFREPAGVVFSAVPWNAPLNLALRAICIPIACGNTVILKPSEYTPASQKLVVDAFTEAGLPPGVPNFLPTSAADSASVSEYCVKAKQVRRVNFTGSTRVGKIFAGWAAEQLKQCIFELGGKANVVVFEDANIDDAAKAVVFGGLINSGQVCMSSERILLHSSIAASFTEKLLTAMKNIKVGNHLKDNSVHLSGLFCEASAQRVVGLIKSAVASGAQVLLGDQTITDHTILQPHILSRVNPSMAIWQEETFGPVVTLTTFNSEDEALRLALDTDTSLTASVFSVDVSRAMRFGRQLHTGALHINGPTVYIEPSLPNGGTGGPSGYGRFGGTTGIREFTDERMITINESGQKYPLVQ